MTPAEKVRTELISARKALGLTQAQLGRLAGVSQQAVAKFESPDANLSISTVVRMARALGLHVEFTFKRATR